MLTQQEYQSLDNLLLSPHFSYLEAINSRNHPNLVVNPCEVTWVHLREFAARQLEEFRSVCCEDTTCLVNSMFRNPALNEAVGGVRKSNGSQHTSVHCVWDEIDNTFLGVAADLTPVHKSIYHAFMRTPLLQEDFRTFIIYPTKGFIHADSQIRRQKKTWYVSITGKTYVEITADEAKNIITVLQNKFHLNITE